MILKTAYMEVKENDVLGTLRNLFSAILNLDQINAILVPWRLPMKNAIMPTLIADPARLSGADPLSPAFPINSARIVSRLTRRPSGGRIAAVMRPCEIRAFVELVKLNQGQTEDLVIIGSDCLGACLNRDFSKWAGDNIDGSTRKFYSSALSGNQASMTDFVLSPACLVCESPIPAGADIAIGLFGIDDPGRIHITGQTEAGEQIMEKLNLKPAEESHSRKKAVEKLVTERTAARDKMFKDTLEATCNLEKLTGYLAGCVNCYNCRVACPVCYCRECVFTTSVFDHDPSQYLRWASRKGVVKMPTDTVFYHITRMAHMSTACVGCGQCSNACPNDIPLMELFRTIAHRTQKSFDYEAGRNTDEKPPLSEFREDEFEEVSGLHWEDR
jgi:formate dehydrogenase subunit beta